MLDRFKEGIIKWSVDLQTIANSVVNQLGPCNTEKTINGETALRYVLSHLKDSKSIHIMTYKGQFT